MLRGHCDILSRRTLCRHHLPGNYTHLSSQGRICSIVNIYHRWYLARSQKVPYEGAEVHKIIPARKPCLTDAALCNWERMRFFCLQFEVSCLLWSFFYLQLTILVFLLTDEVFLLTASVSTLTVGVFFACSGKVRLIRALRGP